MGRSKITSHVAGLISQDDGVDFIRNANNIGTVEWHEKGLSDNNALRARETT